MRDLRESILDDEQDVYDRVSLTAEHTGEIIGELLMKYFDAPTSGYPVEDCTSSEYNFKMGAVEMTNYEGAKREFVSLWNKFVREVKKTFPTAKTEIKSWKDRSGRTTVYSLNGIPMPAEWNKLLNKNDVYMDTISPYMEFFYDTTYKESTYTMYGPYEWIKKYL